MNHPHIEAENNLLNLVAKGDENAFRMLFNLYVDKLSYFVLGWTKNVELTEEIVQDVFLKLWVNRQKITEVKNFDGYLFIACRNHCYNALKKNLTERTKILLWEKSTHDTTEFFPDEEEDVYFNYLDDAVNQLPPRQKEVFHLKMRERLKYTEIGDHLGISPETARKHLNAALKQIRANLSKKMTLIFLFSKFL